MNQITTKTGIIQVFNSTSDYMEFLAQPRHKDCTLKSSESIEKPAWHGTKDFAEALKLASLWDGNFKTDLNLKGIITNYVRVMKSKKDITGGSVNVAKSLTGHPLCMRRSYFENTEGQGGKLINLYFSVEMDVSANQKTGLAWSECMGAILQELEDKSYQVAVNIMSRSGNCIRENGEGKAYTFIRTLKGFNEAWNLKTMSFHLAHPSAVRRLEFRAMENTGNVMGGYGTAKNTTEALIKDIITSGCEERVENIRLVRMDQNISQHEDIIEAIIKDLQLENLLEREEEN